MPALTSLGTLGPLDDGFAMVTVTHAEMGANSFGVAPGSAEIWVTLRTLTDARMENLRSAAQPLAHRTAADNNLQISIRHADAFAHCENNPKAVERLARSIEAEGITFDDCHLPMLASEDFGQFGRIISLRRRCFSSGRARPAPDCTTPITTFLTN